MENPNIGSNVNPVIKLERHLYWLIKTKSIPKYYVIKQYENKVKCYLLTCNFIWTTDYVIVLKWVLM